MGNKIVISPIICSILGSSSAGQVRLMSDVATQKHSGIVTVLNSNFIIEDATLEEFIRLGLSYFSAVDPTIE